MRIIALLLLTTLTASPAFAQFGGQGGERRYTVTSFERIRVDGGFAVEVENGSSSFAVAEGSPRALDGLDISVQGRTLVVRGRALSSDDRNAGPVRIRVGTPELKQAWVNGSGTLEIDRVRGLEFGLSVQGSGRAILADVDVDRLDVSLNGTASARIEGRAEEATLLVRGISALEATGFDSEGVELGVDGPGTVRLGAVEEAEIDAIGASQIMLGGRPACTVRLSGSVELSGCARFSD